MRGPHRCGSSCVWPCPNAQLELRFDLTDDLSSVPPIAAGSMPDIMAALQRSMGMPVRPIDTSTCTTCHGMGDVYVDRSEARDHFTARHLCPDCSPPDDTSDARAEMAAR